MLKLHETLNIFVDPLLECDIFIDLPRSVQYENFCTKWGVSMKNLRSRSEHFMQFRTLSLIMNIQSLSQVSWVQKCRHTTNLWKVVIMFMSVTCMSLCNPWARDQSHMAALKSYLDIYVACLGVMLKIMKQAKNRPHTVIYLLLLCSTQCWAFFSGKMVRVQEKGAI